MPRGVPSETAGKFLALDLQTIKMQLRKIKPKEKETYSKKEAILFLKECIEDLRQKNYDWKDIAAILAEKDISIPASTIKKWIEESDLSNQRSTKSRVRGDEFVHREQEEVPADASADVEDEPEKDTKNEASPPGNEQEEVPADASADIEDEPEKDTKNEASSPGNEQEEVPADASADVEDEPEKKSSASFDIVEDTDI